MNINKQISAISQALQSQDKPITKDEMYELLEDKKLKKANESYRQVTEKPVVIDMVDISDAAAKKFALMMSKNDTPSSTTTSDKPEKIGSKLFGFAKDIFMSILSTIGTVVGWVVTTLTTIVSQLSDWILKKIQTAMVMSAGKSMSGFGRRLGKLGLLSAVVAGGLQAKQGYDIFQGVDQLESQLKGINNQASDIFSSPENMISSGMAAMPGLASPLSTSPASPTMDLSNTDDSSTSTPSITEGNTDSDEEETQSTINDLNISTPPSDTITDNTNISESFVDNKPKVSDPTNYQKPISSIEVDQQPTSNIIAETQLKNIGMFSPSNNINNTAPDINSILDTSTINQNINIIPTSAELINKSSDTTNITPAEDQSVSTMNTSIQSDATASTIDANLSPSLGGAVNMNNNSISLATSPKSPINDIEPDTETTPTNSIPDDSISILTSQLNKSSRSLHDLLGAIQSQHMDYKDVKNMINLPLDKTTSPESSIVKSVSSISKANLKPVSTTTPSTISPIKSAASTIVDQLKQPAEHMAKILTESKLIEQIAAANQKTANSISSLGESISKKQLNITNNNNTQKRIDTDFVNSTSNLRDMARKTTTSN